MSSSSAFVEASPAPASLARPASEGGLADLLFSLLLDVVRIRQPEVEPVLTGKAPLPATASELLLRALQAQGIWLQLLSIVEESASIEERRRIEVERGPDRVEGTFARLVAEMAASDIPAHEIAALLRSAHLRPVITAHPTEAKRVTVLEIHQRIHRWLVELQSRLLTSRERETLVRALRNEIDLLYLTGELRMNNPTVDEEVAWGLHFFEGTLFDQVPKVLESLEWALKEYYPDAKIAVPPFIRFGSWIGGDRDGNPFVTNEVTRRALRRNREASLLRYRRRLDHLVKTLSAAEHSLPVPEGFRRALERALAESGEAKRIAERNPGEVFRQYAACMILKLEATIAATGGATKPVRYKGYQESEALIADLKTMEDGLIGALSEPLAETLIRPLRREVETFRFRTVRLDLRENATVVNDTLQAIWRALNGRHGGTPPAPRSEEWRRWILDELRRPLKGRPRLKRLPREAAETLGMFRLVREMRAKVDREAFGYFILSMTQSPADVLGAYLLAKYAGLFADAEGVEHSTLLVVPLFETIADLKRAPAVLRDLLAVPVVRRTVRQLGGLQEVMIGYSDSDKDAGFLCASWELNKVQAKLARLGEAKGTPIRFFHGRGGSVGRGGAPTGRAIAAQPAGSVQGRMRFTDQGEVVSSKYANPQTAQHELELVAAGVFEHSLLSAKRREVAVDPEFNEAMEALAGTSHAAYRRLVEHPGLIGYFQAASPLDEFLLLKMGSRPPRRFGAATLDDLRAIPWVFAWSQNRHLVPGWYGAGTGLQRFLEVRGPSGAALLQRMFAEFSLFRLIMDEVEKALLHVDLSVARRYAELVPDIAVRDEIFGMIEAEYRRTVALALKIGGGREPGERFPRLRARLRRRLPIINRVGEQQVELIRHFRQAKESRESRRRALIPLLLSFNCVAQGLGWTG